MKQTNEEIIVELAIPERKFSKVYHDFLRNKLLTTEEKMIFIVLKSFIDFSKDNGGTQGEVYPSMDTICTLSSLSRARATRAINKLIEKKIVKKIRRGLSKTNVYILSDYPAMWACDNTEEMETIADSKGDKPLTAEELISKLEKMGYKVKVEKKAKEKRPVSGSRQATDTSTYHSNLHNDTTDEPESQECSMSKTDSDALLDDLWALYPVKKGKGQISAAQRKKLLKIGYDEMARAIERYKQYVESVDYLHYQNGGTFFNGGYMDYLDVNYDPESEREAKSNQAKSGQTKSGQAKNGQTKNRFNDYPHRDYDFDAIKKSMFDQ